MPPLILWLSSFGAFGSRSYPFHFWSLIVSLLFTSCTLSTATSTVSGVLGLRRSSVGHTSPLKEVRFRSAACFFFSCSFVVTDLNLSSGAYWISLSFILIGVSALFTGGKPFGASLPTIEYVLLYRWLCVMNIFTGFAIYLHARAADHHHAVIFTWFTLASAVVGWSLHTALRNDPSSASPPFGPLEGALALLTTLPALAALFYHPRKTATKSSPKKAAATEVSPRSRSRSASGRRRTVK